MTATITQPIPALTVRQPWAWPIVRGWKPDENRSRTTAYRGPLAIHAAKRWDDDRIGAVRFVRDTVRAQGQGDELPRALADDLPYTGTGMVLGVVDLVDVCTAGRRREPCDCSAWAMPGQVHWKLANPRLLRHPFPARGALYLWTVEIPEEAW